MTLQNQTVRNPLTEQSFTFNRNGSPAARDAGDLDKNYGGLRTSVTFYPLSVKDELVTVPLNNIERKDTESSAVPFTIPDSGFYVIGYDADFKATDINDFGLKAFIYNETEEEFVVENKIRILRQGAAQTEYFATLAYFSKGEVLNLQIIFTKGEIILDYAAMFAFRIDDEYDNIPITPYIKAFYYFEEISGIRQDFLGNFPLTPKNSPGRTTGQTNNAVQFSSGSFQALSNNSLDPVAYEDGFTIGGSIKLLPNQNSYAVLAARWKGNNNAKEDQFILYHDHVVNKFIFAFRQTNNVYKFLKSKNSYDSSAFNRVSVSYDKNNSSITLYLNGIAQQSIKTVGISAATTQDFSVGAYNITENNPLEHSNCIIDNLLVSCYPYASDAIKAIYNKGDSLNFQGLIDLESDSGLGTGTGTGGGTGPGASNADQVSFNNSTANINNSPSNVQTALEGLAAEVDAVVSSSFMAYKHTFNIGDWVFNPSTDYYEIIVPVSSHNLSNPCNFQTAKSESGSTKFATNCIVSVDNGTKDVKLEVNVNPDARFQGILSMISI